MVSERHMVSRGAFVIVNRDKYCLLQFSVGWGGGRGGMGGVGLGRERRGVEFIFHF